MLSDAQLLSQVPEFIQFGMMLKATPSVEGDARIIYVEASKESVDQQGEIVLEKALKDSVDIFRKFGVIDLDHKSMPSVAAQCGIDNPEDWIIGRPLDVVFNDKVTFVKAQLRSGESGLADKANRVWEGMTKLNPPDRYYASVGGAVLGREIKIDPKTGNRVPVITKTRWNNLALSLNPVHAELDPAGTAAIGTFAKSMGGYIIKALEASYATDSVGMTGGGALRMQSIDTGNAPMNYFDFRDKLAAAMRNGLVGENPGARELVVNSSKMFGLSLSDAAEYVERFYRDLKTGLTKKRSNK